MSETNVLYKKYMKAKRKAGKAVGREADLEFRVRVGEPLEKRLHIAIANREQAVRDVAKAKHDYMSSLEQSECVAN